MFFEAGWAQGDRRITNCERGQPAGLAGLAGHLVFQVPAAVLGRQKVPQIFLRMGHLPAMLGPHQQMDGRALRRGQGRDEQIVEIALAVGHVDQRGPHTAPPGPGRSGNSRGHATKFNCCTVPTQPFSWRKTPLAEVVAWISWASFLNVNGVAADCR